MAKNSKQQELFQYVLILKKEKSGYTNIISFLACLICWLFFLFYCFIRDEYTSLLFIFSFLVPLALIHTVWNILKKDTSVTYKYPLLATGFVWLWVPGMRWIFIFFILFILLDHQSRQPLEVGVSDENIVINTFFRKRFQWPAFRNVILKDNLLTLDYANNKILQREILPYESDVDEREFNEFCRQQLAKQAPETHA